MPILPYFVCDVQGCGFYRQRIALPFPNPPKTISNQMPWPPDGWFSYIACPGCGQVLRRTKDDIQWADDNWPGLDNQKWIGMSFECDGMGCEAPMQIYAQFPSDSNNIQIASYFDSERISGYLHCGHRYLGYPMGCDLFLVGGPMPAYNPKRTEVETNPI
jgi:hypothetical protein